MSHSGVRKRLKVRWLARTTDNRDSGGFAHAFPLLKGGTVRDYSMCGQKLQSMHLWFAAKDRGGKFSIGQCVGCSKAMGKGGRA